MTDPHPSLTGENAQKVLARALELEAQSTGALTVTQIREIASELSIPATALDQALAEYGAADAAAVPSRAGATAVTASRQRHRSARRIVISLAFVGGAVVLLTILTIVMRLFPSL